MPTLRCVCCVMRTTAWKLYVGLWVGLCDIQSTFLWWISRSAVRRNVVMSDYVMSNYVTLRRQRPVCQFSCCPQRDMSPLWPVIKKQGNATSDCQTVASDGGGKSQALALITLLLHTFVIRLGHFLNSRKTHIAARKPRFRFRFRLKTGGFRFRMGWGCGLFSLSIAYIWENTHISNEGLVWLIGRWCVC